MPLPVLAELIDSAVVVRVPLRVRFRGVDAREVMLLHGPVGWAEFGPFAEYPDEEAAAWLRCALEAGWSGWPTPRRPVVPVNATVPAVPAEQVPDVLRHFDGCATVKVKVAEAGQTPGEDIARVAAVRQVLGPQAAIRVDANGGWTPVQAAELLTVLADFGLEYAEQPCRTVPELVELRDLLTGTGVRLAADETIRRAADPLAVARTGAIDVAVLKVAPLGGVAATLAIAAELDALGVEVVISSALDTSVGIAAGVAAAAALPRPPSACGLGTAGLLAADIADPAMLPACGALAVRTVVPDPVLLARYRVVGERRDWWVARLTRCLPLIAAEASVDRTSSVD